MAWEEFFIPSGGGIYKRQLFTSDGTWPVPDKIQGDPLITMIGGGGSGSSAVSCSGGNGGQYVVRSPVDVSSLSSVSVVVGAGGASVNGGGTDTPGNPGAASSFGALLSVSGGVGGATNRSPQSNGNGTLGSSGDPNSPFEGQSTVGIFGGAGGISFDGNGGPGGGGLVIDEASPCGGDVAAVGHQASGGKGYGAGGASTASNSSDSGSGAPGAVLVEWMETV